MLRSLLFLLLLHITSVFSQTITGTIVSCSGWKLNRYPHVKSFLKDFLAESYRGVDVEYVRGKPAVLSIYSDGELQEEITLFDITTLDDLHKKMLEKGFVLLPDDEIAVMKENKEAEAVAEEVKKKAEREMYRKKSEERKKAKIEAAAEVAAAAAAEEKVSAGEL